MSFKSTAKHLLYHACIGGTTALSGDAVCQLIEGRKFEEFDTKRSRRFLITGVIAGLVFPAWFPFLERTVTSSRPKLLPFKKVAIHMALMNPVFLAFTISVLRLVEGLSIEKTVESVRKDFYPMWINSWKVWPWAILAKYYLVPPRWRLVFLRTVNVGWMTVVSFLTQRNAARSLNSSTTTR